MRMQKKSVRTGVVKLRYTEQCIMHLQIGYRLFFNSAIYSKEWKK